ncbi:MAG: RNA polymerase sigma factor [Planctomycetes bacterium]|nr:RNA polymerase sigma factor [Planctomycetota bacterium]
MSDPHDPPGRDEPGRQTSLEALLVSYMPELKGYVQRRAEGLVAARESSQDLLQSVCCEILDHLSRFQHGGAEDFRNWVFRTADRKIVDKHRYWKAQRRDGVREDPGLHDPSGDQTPSRVAVGREEFERVKRALESLPGPQCEVVVLSRVFGLRHAEIAQRLGKSEGAVRNILSRALAEVARQLAGGPAGNPPHR